MKPSTFNHEIKSLYYYIIYSPQWTRWRNRVEWGGHCFEEGWGFREVSEGISKDWKFEKIRKKKTQREVDPSLGLQRFSIAGCSTRIPRSNQTGTHLFSAFIFFLRCIYFPSAYSQKWLYRSPMWNNVMVAILYRRWTSETATIIYQGLMRYSFVESLCHWSKG